MKRHVLIYGLVGGVLITLLQWTQYRFLVVEHSVEIYGALIAALFAALGIWLGLKLTRPKTQVVVKEVPVPASQPFVADDRKPEDLGITQPRNVRKALRSREHRQDQLHPRLLQARSATPHPGRPARQRIRFAAVKSSSKRMILSVQRQNHPKG